MKSTGTIATERLVLRRFRQEDAEPMFNNWASDPEVTEFLTWFPHLDVKDTNDIVRMWIRQYDFGSLDWCITLRKDDVPIGGITAVQEFPSEGYCEIGMCLSKDFWNRGIMTEAFEAVIQYIFENTRYILIRARYDLENHASGRVMEKCGLSPIGEFTDTDKRGRERTFEMMGITRADYRR